MVVIVGPNTWGDYWTFIKSVVTNTWEVPRIIINNIYAIGFNGFYILYLVMYTLLMWGVAFIQVYFNWLLPIFGLTIIGAYYLLYYVRYTLGWLFFYTYNVPIVFVQWSIEVLWYLSKWLVQTTWEFIKWSYNTFIAFVKWSYNTFIAFVKWSYNTFIAVSKWLFNLIVDVTYNVAYYTRYTLGWIFFFSYNWPIVFSQWIVEFTWGIFLPACWDLAKAIWDFTVAYWSWVWN